MRITMHLLTGTGLSYVFSVISLVLIARLFPFGFISDVKAVIIHSGWLSTVFSFQLHAGYLYFSGKTKYPEELKSFFNLAVAVLFVICSGIFYLMYPLLYRSDDVSRWGLLAFSIFCGVNMVYIMTPSVFVANGLSDKVPIFMFKYASANFAAILASYIFKLGVNGYAITQTTLLLLVVCTSEWKSNAKGMFERIERFKYGNAAELLKYSLKLNTSTIFEILADRVDKVVVSIFFSKVLFAKYTVLSLENPFVPMMLNSYGITLVKRYKYGIEENKSVFINDWKNMIKIVTFITFPVSIFCIFESEAIVRIVFGERYLDLGVIMSIYMLVSLVRYAPFQVLMRIEGMVFNNVKMAIMFFLTSVIVCFLLLMNNVALKYLPLTYLGGWIAFNTMALYYFKKSSNIHLSKILCFDVWASRIIYCILALTISRYISYGKVLEMIIIYSMTYLILTYSFDSYLRKSSNNILEKLKPYFER